MKASILFQRALPPFRFAVLFLALSALPCMGAENSKKAGGKPLFTWDLLWTGSWYKSIPRPDNGFPPIEDLFSGGTLFNRGDLDLSFPGLGISSRFLATDKRLLPFESDDGKAGFKAGLGIYHNSSGSRFLWGVQSEYGLPARLSRVWLRSVPFMESRSPSSRDLKTEPAALDAAESYLYLSLPSQILPGAGAFASVALDDKQNAAFGGGISLGGPVTEMRLEGFLTQKELAPRKISTWFSGDPPLPARDFRIYAMGMLFNSPLAAFAADWAWSETFAWGRGMYGNFSLRLGDKPWRFSLGGDGAQNRFADRNGATAGPGFRVAAKGERFWPRSGLLRLQGTFKSPALDESFDWGTISLYFRPSAPAAASKKSGIPLRFTRASLDLTRNAKIPEKTDDSIKALVGFYLGPLNAEFYCTLHSLSCLESNGKFSPLFQPQFFETFDSLKLSAALGFKPGIFDLRARLAYTTRAAKDPLWELSMNCTVKPGKWGRISLNVASTDFPAKWNYTLSWSAKL